MPFFLPAFARGNAVPLEKASSLGFLDFERFFGGDALSTFASPTTAATAAATTRLRSG